MTNIIFLLKEGLWKSLQKNSANAHDGPLLHIRAHLTFRSDIVQHKCLIAKLSSNWKLQVQLELA